MAGVANVILYDNGKRQVYTYRGSGAWPAAMTPDYFDRFHKGKWSNDGSCCIVPQTAEVWFRVLKEHGTMTFGQVAAAALEYASNGFPMHETMLDNLIKSRRSFDVPGMSDLYFPGGAPPKLSDVFVQRELAGTLTRLMDVEAKASGGREAGIQAIRDHFYTGPIAKAMVEFVNQHGGFFSLSDFEESEAACFPPVKTDFGPYTVFGCGPFSQGPVVPIALTILREFDLKSMGHNTPEYLHHVIEALDLALSDRFYHMGDPTKVAVPIEGLLSPEYAKARSKLIQPRGSFTEMAPRGEPWDYQDRNYAWPHVPTNTLAVYDNVPVPEPNPVEGEKTDDNTTSAVCADSQGNFFSATFSDGFRHKPGGVPGLGLTLCNKGSQSWPHPGNPNSVGPRKRPRLTVNPGLIFKDGKAWAAYATPAGDRQTQTMLQVFLNIAVFDMDPQDAIQAPRVGSFNFPAGTPPQEYLPGLVCCEGRIPTGVVEGLRKLGHQVQMWPDYEVETGASCIAIRESKGVFKGAADPRRQSYAIAL